MSLSLLSARSHHWQRISFSELRLGRAIGAGSYGVVHEGAWRGSEVAIKRFTLTELSADAVADFHDEAYTMSQLQHPNIVLFLGACIEPPHLALITERLEMSVRDLLASTAPLRVSHLLRMAADAARGVAVLHARAPPILHRDLKSSNLLVDTGHGGDGGSGSGGGSGGGGGGVTAVGGARGELRVCVCGTFSTHFCMCTHCA